MRILLLGELSGVHQELAPGLRALGHEVVVGHGKMANPDFESDIPFYRAPKGSNGATAALRDIASQLFNGRRLTGFDIVQIITPKFFNWKIHGPMMRYLKRNNRRMVVLNVACTSDYFRRVADLAYRPCKECLQFDQQSDRCLYDRPDEQAAEYLAFDLADAIVATHFEYRHALSDTRFAEKLVSIPLPIDTQRHRPLPMPPLNRVRIWYGETRFGFKGSAFILPAIERLEAGPLRDEIEVVRTGRLTFEDYLDFLGTMHIAIDQASSYGMGMNALHALARGRVALTGAEPETLDFVGVSANDNPMINIRPDADMIHDALADLVRRKAELPEIGRRSAEYVERVHAADKIADRYGALYSALLGSSETRPLHPAKAI